MGRMSRNKGNSYERRIAKAFSKVYKRELRRVPLSGGIVLKCDIYDPTNDDFPLFIECKTGYKFTLQGVLDGSSPVFKFLIDTSIKASESHMADKYASKPIPVVVFRGGHFNYDMVALFDNSYFVDKRLDHKAAIIKSAGVTFVKLSSFLSIGTLPPLLPKLQRRFQVRDESDSE